MNNPPSSNGLEWERNLAIELLEAIAERLGKERIFDSKQNDTKWFDFEDMVTDMVKETTQHRLLDREKTIIPNWFSREDVEAILNRKMTEEDFTALKQRFESGCIADSLSDDIRTVWDDMVSDLKE